MSVHEPRGNPLALAPEAQEKFEAFSGNDLDHLRELCRTDLYILAKVVLGYNQVCEETHGALCQFMVTEELNRRLVLMPRGHLKTTICTIADSIRLSLKDPESRILIQNEVFDNASDMLNELKNHWSGGGLLPSLFPELLPEKFSGPGIDWAKDAASINRSRVSKESTYTAAGSGGSPQSKHFTVIKNDDLIGEKHKESELEMARSKRWCDAMVPLLDSPVNQLDWYGTRKTMSDVYAHVMEVYGDEIAVFIREPIENGEPIFPLKYPMKELLRIMTNQPEVWAHDFMNNPIGRGGLDWGKGLLRNYSLLDDRVVYQHNLSEATCTWMITELDIVITVDPNSGRKMSPDKAAVVVHGCSPEEQIFVLDSWSDRCSPDGLIDKVWERALRWHPRLVGIEEAGQQNTLYYFEKRCMQEGRFFRMKPLHHQNVHKEKRIRTAIDTPLKARRIYVLPSQMTLISQIQLFPQLAAHNWDEIDAFSYGPEVYQAGMAMEDLEADHSAEELLFELRGLTGYGVSV